MGKLFRNLNEGLVFYRVTFLEGEVVEDLLSLQQQQQKSEKPEEFMLTCFRESKRIQSSELTNIIIVF